MAEVAFRAARELLHYFIARTTDGGRVDPRAFERARRTVLSDPAGKQYAPECVRFCREPDAAWSYVKGHADSLPTHESRRVFFRQQFAPLLDALERFENSPLDELVEVEAEELSSASVS